MTYTETTTRSWGGRILDSIKSIAIGFVLFIISFGVLYWNEGRVDLSEIAKTSVEIDSGITAGIDYNGKLISTTGNFLSEEIIGDEYLKPGEYIALERIVETFAWKENTQTDTKTNLGGSETTTKTYTYAKKWVISPENSSSFKEPEGHTNINPTISKAYNIVKLGTIGIYSLNMNNITLPIGKKLYLSKDIIIETNGVKYESGEYLYKTTNSGSLTNPKIGDIKISYKAVSHINNATVFGKYISSSKKISIYYDKDNNKLYRVFEGERAGSISKLKTEYTTSLWVLRLVGFIIMYVGINMVFAPLSVFLDVLPFLGSVSRIGVSIISFIIAFILSLTTIIISIIIHNIIALITVIILFIGLTIWYIKKKEQKTEII